MLYFLQLRLDPNLDGLRKLLHVSILSDLSLVKRGVSF